VTFDEAHKELEEIVAKLETGQAPLDEMTALWKRGEELYALCRAQLDAAQGRIEELAKGAAQGDEILPGA
jgi:exodeoxyribonuclease VII small subunit